MRRQMPTAKTTMHPAASPERNYMLDASAAIRQQHHLGDICSVESSPSAVQQNSPSILAAFGQVLGSLTDYNLASADEDDLSVLRSIAPSHHSNIVEINPNGLCFEIGALHPRGHCRKLSLPGLILLQP